MKITRLGEIILHHTANWNFSFPQLHLDRVEAVGDFNIPEQVEIRSRDGTQRLLLALVDCLRRRHHIRVGAGLHLDENEDFAVTANQVEFPA